MPDKNIQVSKAPPPITPIKSAFARMPNPFNTEVKGATDWKYWRHVATVEIWQALLLSLNIEPPGKGWLLDNAPGRTGDIPREYLDTHGLNDEFERRWYLVGNRLETLYASMDQPRKAELTNFLQLPLFAAWAVEFEWSDLPPELVALSHEPTVPEDAAAPSGAPRKAPPAPVATDDLPSESAFRPKVGWQIELFDSWLEICKTHGRIPTASESIRWLKRNSKNGVILSEGTKTELWWIPQRKDKKRVDVHSVENVISKWKAYGVLPS